LVFTHLILHHYHYLMMFSPAIAILSAVALAWVEQFLIAQRMAPALIRWTAAAILFAGLFQGLMTMRAFTFDPYPKVIAAKILSHTVPADKLIVINGGWGGDELIRTGRQGLSMWSAKAFEDPASYARLKQLGFTKLVIVSEPRYHNAMQIVNPTQVGIPRIMAESFVTPRVAGWPTVYETEDLIIKDIP
jgi:hypothetical protein